MIFRRLWIFLLAAALALSTSQTPRPASAQQTPDDSDPLDPSFNHGGVLYPHGEMNPHGFDVQPDGKVILVGSQAAGAAADMITRRFTLNGRIDDSFSGNGSAVTGFGPGDEWGYVPIILGDGRILSVGWGIWEGAYGLAVAHHLENGRLDTRLNGDGKLWIGLPIGREFHVGGALLQPDGKILIAGGYTADDNGNAYPTRFLVRYTADGQPDTAFGANGVVNDHFIASTAVTFQVYDVALAHDGSIITVGYLDDGLYAQWMVDVYNPDGSHRANIPQPPVDPACRRAGCDDHAGGVEVQPDGKIVIAGAYTTLSDPLALTLTQTFYIMRFNPDWSLDAAFDGDGQVTTVVTPRPDLGQIRDRAYDVAIQPDGRIVVVGASGGDFALARYLPNGRLDRGFGDDGVIKTDLGGDDIAYTVRLQPNGKILALGTRRNPLTGVTHVALARYRAYPGDPLPDPGPGPTPAFPFRVTLPLVGK